MTNYIAKIEDISLEGDAFDGSYNQDVFTVFEDVSFTANQYRVFSLENIIPGDGYDYEVHFSCFANTGTTSGNSVSCYLCSGTVNDINSSFNASMCRAITRANSTQMPAGPCILPIKGNDRNITFVNNTDSVSGITHLYITAMRRLGTNLKSVYTNYISNIATPRTQNLSIGGPLLGGQWVVRSRHIVGSKSLGTSSSFGYSLSEILPNDGYTYELLINAYGQTGTSSGNQITLRVGTSSSILNNPIVGRQVTRTSSYMETGGSRTVLAKSTDTLYVANSGQSGTCKDVNLITTAYRRVGTSNSKQLKTICIKSKSLTPNAIIYGNPIISGNTVSNFSSTNYLDVSNMRYNVGEYVICFTVDTSSLTEYECIMHIEKFLSLQIKSGYQVYTHTWNPSGDHTIFTATPGVKYYVKIEVNGTSRKYSYSTNGVDYTLVVDTTDNGTILNSDYNLRFGTNSDNSLSSHAFTGSIHLDECYIKINNDIIWQGMDYKKRLPIGGYIADMPWVYSSRTIYTDTQFSKGTQDFLIADYLPENGVQYEILCRAYGRTGSSSGNTCRLSIQSSEQIYGNPIISRIITRSNNVIDSKSFIIVGIQYENQLPIIIENSGTSTTGGCGLIFVGYRRIGNNT